MTLFNYYVSRFNWKRKKKSTIDWANVAWLDCWPEESSMSTGDRLSGGQAKTVWLCMGGRRRNGKFSHDSEFQRQGCVELSGKVRPKSLEKVRNRSSIEWFKNDGLKWSPALWLDFDSFFWIVSLCKANEPKCVHVRNSETKLNRSITLNRSATLAFIFELKIVVRDDSSGRQDEKKREDEVKEKCRCVLANRMYS